MHEIHALGPPERMRAPAERRRAAQAAMGMLMQTAAAIVAESGAMSAQQEAEVRRLIDEANQPTASQRSSGRQSCRCRGCLRYTIGSPFVQYVSYRIGCLVRFSLRACCMVPARAPLLGVAGSGGDDAVRAAGGV